MHLINLTLILHPKSVECSNFRFLIPQNGRRMLVFLYPKIFSICNTLATLYGVHPEGIINETSVRMVIIAVGNSTTRKSLL